jgi:hypothetical protein
MDENDACGVAALLADKPYKAKNARGFGLMDLAEIDAVAAAAALTSTQKKLLVAAWQKAGGAARTPVPAPSKVTRTILPQCS